MRRERWLTALGSALVLVYALTRDFSWPVLPPPANLNIDPGAAHGYPLAILVALLVVSIYSFASERFGSLLLPAAPISMRFLLGVGILGGLGFILGGLGILAGRNLTLCLLLGVVSSGFRRPLSFGSLESLRALRSVWRHATWDRRLATALIVSDVVLSCLLALYPPVGWDALAYHLVAARAYADAGKLFVDAQQPMWLMPQFGEVVFAELLACCRLIVPSCTASWLSCPAVSWSEILACQLIGVIALLGTLGSLAHAAVWLSDNAASGFWTVATIVGIPTVMLMAGAAYTDPFVLAFLAAGYATYAASSKLLGSPWRPVLVGVFGGLALASKYTGGIGTVMLGLLIFLDQPEPLRFDARSSFRRIAPTVLFALGVITGFLPAGMKNLLLSHNPVAPFLWGTTAMPPVRVERWLHEYPFPGLLRVLTYPILGPMTGSVGSFPFDADWGPALLPLTALAIVLGSACRRSRVWSQRIAFAGIVGIWIVAIFHSGFASQGRLHPEWYVLGGVAAGILCAQPQFRSRLARGLVLFALLLGSFQLLRTFWGRDTIPVLIGQEAPSLAIARDLPGYLGSLNAAPPSATVLAIAEPRSFYSRSRMIPDTLLDNWPELVNGGSSAKDIRVRLASRGVTDVLVFVPGLTYLEQKDYRWRPIDTQSWKEFVQQDLALVADTGAYRLYQLRPSPPQAR